ncbi:MAG: Holliday junction resolvase RuvX [Chloroflexi bacterium]|nr:Holliday junction resolvase RuvX [Chloroflexota bacterium]
MDEPKINARLLGIDPGEKRIGISISDPSGTISRPLLVIQFISYTTSAQQIVKLCEEKEVGQIIIGISYDRNENASFSGRRGLRLGDAIHMISDIPIIYWDEHGTTRGAQRSRIQMGVKKKKRQGHLDDVAACILLQSYIDEQITQKGIEQV